MGLCDDGRMRRRRADVLVIINRLVRQRPSVLPD